MTDREPYELLERISAVKAPDHLRTQLAARIQRVEHDRIPTYWALAIAATILLLITLNTGAIVRANSNQSGGLNDAEILSSSMGLTFSDQLYYE